MGNNKVPSNSPTHGAANLLRTPSGTPPYLCEVSLNSDKSTRCLCLDVEMMDRAREELGSSIHRGAETVHGARLVHNAQYIMS